MRFTQGGECFQRSRRVKGAVGVTHGEAVGILQAAQLRQQMLLGGRGGGGQRARRRGQVIVLRGRNALAHGVHRLRGRHDGSIAGAAAQVAGQRVVDGAAVGIGLGLVQREHRHHEARSAEAALRAVAVGQRLLDRMQRGAALQRLDGEQRAAVEGRQELDAGVDGAVADVVADGVADDHGARAAVAFGAALLGADSREVFAEVLQDRPGRGDVMDLADLAVEHEPDGIAHVSPPREVASVGGPQQVSTLFFQVGLPSAFIY